jgi:hypothetical protein
VAYLVYGEEIMGMIIQNAGVAKSMRQVLRMIGNKR